jgi:UMP-CMP kinase
MCELAEQQLGWTHLSAGDLLRAEKNAGGEQADLINDYITQGKIVPVEITVKLLQKAMAECTNNTGKVNFLIDGFPRNQNNWDGWMSVFGKEAEQPAMLFFECPWEVQEERILGRAKYSGRSDDNPESLKKRFVTFKEETLPIR